MLRPTLVQRALVLACTAVVAACSGAQPSVAPTDRPTVGPSATTASVATPSPERSPTSSPSPSPIEVLAGESWIAYQGGTGGPARIRLVRPDGTGDHELTPGNVPGEQSHPDWSHDGKRVAFALDADGTRDIWVANVDGSEARQVYSCAAPCAWTDDPAWSPDDTKIVFEGAYVNDVDTGDAVSTVEILDLTSGTTRPIYDAPLTEYVYGPRWSPDGQAIVFEVDRFGTARLDDETVLASTLVIADVAGPAEARPLLPWDSWASTPDWHPTEDRIVYVAPTKAGRDPADVHVVGLDGKHPERVTDFGPTGGWGIQPAWTPDGKRIIFVGEDKVRTTPNAATVRPDGSGLERMAWDGTYRTHPRLRPTP